MSAVRFLLSIDCGWLVSVCALCAFSCTRPFDAMVNFSRLCIFSNASTYVGARHSDLILFRSICTRSSDALLVERRRIDGAEVVYCGRVEVLAIGVGMRTTVDLVLGGTRTMRMFSSS